MGPSSLRPHVPLRLYSAVIEPIWPLFGHFGVMARGKGVLDSSIASIINIDCTKTAPGHQQLVQARLHPSSMHCLLAAQLYSTKNHHKVDDLREVSPTLPATTSSSVPRGKLVCTGLEPYTERKARSTAPVLGKLWSCCAFVPKSICISLPNYAKVSTLRARFRLRS